MISNYMRILSVQDISCVGQCSLTVALPILSACGFETSVLPSAVLSNHTVGFKGYTCLDLTDEMPKIIDQWKTEGISFGAVYTGYLENAKQISYVNDIFSSLLTPGGLKVVDPAMADFGSLYPEFDQSFVSEMKKLVFASDLTLPNITEACCLTGTEYRENYDQAYINELMDGLRQQGAKTVVLTGVSYDEATTGIEVYEGDSRSYYRHEKLPVTCHGTGDIFSSVFTGAYLRGKSAFESAKIAADFTLECIRNTAGDTEHWYGVKFEPVLGKLIEELK